MHLRLHHILFAILLFTFIGCSERERVSSDYVLVTPTSWNPDGHPGTALRRRHKVVWGNIYTGCFYPSSPRNFAHDGMMVFVGPLPAEGDWDSCKHFFAVRGDGPPTVLDERLLQKPLTVLDNGNERVDFAVSSLAFTNGGFRVQFEHNAVTRTSDVSWADIKRFLDEADTSAKLVRHHLGDYRLFP